MELLRPPLKNDDYPCDRFFSNENMAYSEILSPLGFTHIQSWYTLGARHIYQHPKGFKLFVTGHGDDCVLYFDSIDIAEKAYMIYIKDVDGNCKCKLNTIYFPFLNITIKNFTEKYV